MYYMKTIKKKKEMNKTHTQKKLAKILVKKKRKNSLKNKTKETCKKFC